MAGVSGFGRLLRTQGPGSSHAIGVSAPFTVWAVDPLLGGNNNKKNPYKKKIVDANGRGLCQKMQLTPVNLWIQRF